MTSTRKLILAAAGIVILLLACAIVSTAPTLGGRRYFEDGRCACGYDSYILLHGTDYLTYTPGHGYPPRRAFVLRPRDDIWEMLAPGDRSNGMFYSFGPAEGTVVGRLRFQHGDLWEQLAGSSNWTRHARVYNRLPIWLAKLRAEPPPSPNCINNLKQIGLAFREWALDHNDQFPFNVPTNAGGTLEFCALDKEGFDRHAALHFQVMSNELNTPLMLICPKDRSRKAATSFSILRAVNVTYRLRSGTNLAHTNRAAVLVVCPVDGNTLYCDGSVAESRQARDTGGDGRIRVR
jgi:prepilin-type processing-associated H-X9-DG protein